MSLKQVNLIKHLGKTKTKNCNQIKCIFFSRLNIEQKIKSIWLQCFYEIIIILLVIIIICFRLRLNKIIICSETE